MCTGVGQNVALTLLKEVNDGHIILKGYAALIVKDELRYIAFTEDTVYWQPLDDGMYAELEAEAKKGIIEFQHLIKTKYYPEFEKITNGREAFIDLFYIFKSVDSIEFVDGEVSHRLHDKLQRIKLPNFSAYFNLTILRINGDFSERPPFINYRVILNGQLEHAIKGCFLSPPPTRGEGA